MLRDEAIDRANMLVDSGEYKELVVVATNEDSPNRYHVCELKHIGQWENAYPVYFATTETRVLQLC